MVTSRTVALSKVKHLSLKFTHLDNFSFSAETNAVPLLPLEVAQASHYFPIFFPDRLSTTPYALLGLGKKNIFVDADGTWNSQYIPLVFSNYPFSILKVSFKEEIDGKKRDDEYAIAVDESAPHFNQEGGQPLFKENGDDTDLLINIKKNLISQYKSYLVMTKAFAELSLHDSFSSDPISVFYKGTKKNISGLRYVSHKKIFQLPEVTLGHWVKTGLMEILYAHWQSFLNFPHLLEDSSCPDVIKLNPDLINRSNP